MSDGEKIMTEIEAREAMRGLARMARAFYAELLDEAFAPHEALKLTGQWLIGLASGSASS